jgi:ribosomal protein S6--L-glutamate ligase
MGRHGLEVYYQDEIIERIDAIIPRIGASATSYGAAVIRQFELNGVYSTVQTEALLRSRDKRTCFQHLVAHGLSVPDTVVVGEPSEILNAIDRVGPPPVIIKLLSSTHGIGVIKADTHKTAESVIEGFLRLKQKVILQRFIQESAGTDLRVLVVDDKIVAAMERVAAEGEFRSNIHRGAVGRKVNLTLQERDVAIKAAKVMKLKVAGVDLLRSANGPLVLEVNASPGLEGIEGVTGIDVAGKIIQLIERNARYEQRRFSR